MISEEMQQVVLDMLVEWREDGTRRKYSQRGIAKLTGISRGSVGAIKKRGRIKAVIRRRPTSQPPETEYCDRCGTMALTDEPCGECKLRRLHKQIKPVGHPASNIVLELRTAEQQRYKEVLDWRAAEPVSDIDLP